MGRVALPSLPLQFISIGLIILVACGCDLRKPMEPLLLVEDKSELRAMLRKALERNGFRWQEAGDGSAAMQKIRANVTSGVPILNAGASGS